jgi:hypothetical protein
MCLVHVESHFQIGRRAGRQGAQEMAAPRTCTAPDPISAGQERVAPPVCARHSPVPRAGPTAAASGRRGARLLGCWVGSPLLAGFRRGATVLPRLGPFRPVPSRVSSRGRPGRTDQTASSCAEQLWGPHWGADLRQTAHRSRAEGNGRRPSLPRCSATARLHTRREPWAATLRSAVRRTAAHRIAAHRRLATAGLPRGTVGNWRAGGVLITY